MSRKKEIFGFPTPQPKSKQQEVGTSNATSSYEEDRSSRGWQKVLAIALLAGATAMGGKLISDNNAKSYPPQVYVYPTHLPPTKEISPTYTPMPEPTETQIPTATPTDEPTIESDNETPEPLPTIEPETGLTCPGTIDGLGMQKGYSEHSRLHIGQRVRYDYKQGGSFNLWVQSYPGGPGIGFLSPDTIATVVGGPQCLPYSSDMAEVYVKVSFKDSSGTRIVGWVLEVLVNDRLLVPAQ